MSELKQDTWKERGVVSVKTHLGEAQVRTDLTRTPARRERNLVRPILEELT